MGPELRPGDVQKSLQQIRQRLPDGEDRLEYRDDHYTEDHRPPDTMQEQGVEPLRPNRSGGAAILRVLAHAYGPFAVAARASHNRQFQWLRAGDSGVQEILHGHNSLARSSADQCDRRTELTRQRQHIYVAALL